MPPARSRPAPYGRAPANPPYQPNSSGHRLCPFPGCGDTVPFYKFSCFSHWQRMPAALRDRATALWKDYLDKTLTAAGLSKMRAAVVDEALDADRTLGDPGSRVLASDDALTMSVEACAGCSAVTVVIPVGTPTGPRVSFDPVDAPGGVYVCIAGTARLRPGGVSGRPALARLNPHAETCRGRPDRGVA